MKGIVLSILVIISSACSTLRKDHDDKNTEKEFIPAIRSFERDFKVEVTVPVTFDEFDTRLAGVCQLHKDGFKIIKINKPVWKNLNEEQKEILVYHELVHCELGLDHLPPVQYDNGCPMGLMIPMIFTPHQSLACYKKNRAYYIGQVNMQRIFK